MADKLVRVEWEDTSTMSSWRLREDILKEKRGTSMCESVGWLLKDTEDEFVIAATRNEDDKFADSTSIPKANIRSIKQLRTGR